MGVSKLMSKYLNIYTFVNEPTEIIINVIGSTEKKARQAIDSVLDHANITLPESKWELLGSVPQEENW